MNKDKNKLIWDVLTLVTSLLMLTLILLYWFRIIDFYGALFLSIVAVTLYVLCFFQTIILSSRQGRRKHKLQIVVITLPAILYSTMIVASSEIFKSDRILTARGKHEKYSYNLIFRENGKLERELPILLPLPQKTIYIDYQQPNDSLLVISRTEAILDTLLIDASENALFFQKDSLGNFLKHKEYGWVSLYHYDIIE